MFVVREEGMQPRQAPSKPQLPVPELASLPRPPTRNGAMPAVVVVLIIVVVFIGLLAIEVGLTVFRRLTQRTQYPRAVMASHAQAIINLTDIPETGWPTSSPGSNETAAWTA